jgi:hypothetical protein
MTIPGFPDPRQKAFTDGWMSASGFPGTGDQYWDPRTGAWLTRHSTDYTISDVGISSPDVKFKSPEEVYKGVEQSWSQIKGQHPNAFFDPRQLAWREITARTTSTTPSTGPTTAELARRMQLAKPELDELDRELQAGRLKPDEYDRKRGEILRKYGLPEAS